MINYNINLNSCIFWSTLLGLSSFTYYYYYYGSKNNFDYKKKNLFFKRVLKPNKNGNNVSFSNNVKIIIIPNRFQESR